MNDVSHNFADRRQSHRLTLHHPSRLCLTLDGEDAQAGTIGGVTLTDVSREGLMAADAGQLVPGAKILLEVPLVGWRETEVIWIAGNRAGCRFAAPLDIDELRLAAANSDRLAKECPDLAIRIAQATIAEEHGTAAPTEPVEEMPAARWPLLGFAMLAAASFAGASWFLG